MFSKLLRKCSKASKVSNSLPSRFRMEMLETRQMMAGDVAASVVNGNLYISEALGQSGLDNGVRVFQVSPGVVRVMGSESASGDASTSLVNGQQFQDFMITGDLNVSLGAGNDRLHLGYDGGATAPQFNNVNINMGASDLVIAQTSSLAKGGLGGVGGIYNPPDRDEVMGWGFGSRGVTTINTGIGNDWVFIGNSYIGDGWGVDKLTINTGAGADTASIKGTTILGNLLVQTYSNAAENDGDFVWMDSTIDANFNTRATYITGNSEIYTGEGDDGFWLGDSTDPYFFGLGFQSLGSVHLSMAGGADSVDVSAAKFGDNSHWSNLSIYTGAGNDDVTINFHQSLIEVGQPWPELTGSLFIHTYGSATDADVDSVNIPLAQVWKSVYVYLGGGDDNFSLTGNFGDNLYVDAGAGNDAGYLAGFLYNKAEVKMGEGNDSLTLGHVNAYQLKIDGGNGVDSLRKLQPLAVDYLFQTGWEYINGRPQWVLDNAYNVQSATLAKH